MSLSVLSDEEIKGLLEDLTIDELEDFRAELRAALHDYSNGTQLGDSDIHQPERTIINSTTTGAKTLFMPSACPTGIGVKVITLSPSEIANARTHSTSADLATPARIRPTGAITLFSETGSPIGLLHASTLTAFRTALASNCLIAKRNRVHTLTVFGTGEQAYWHVRLALILRGNTIRHVNFINHRFSTTTKGTMKRLIGVPLHIKEREGWKDCQFGIVTPSYGEFERLVREQVRAADVIFCCTPSMEPLFDHTILTNTEGRKKGRLIIAIGSFTPAMREIPIEVLIQATKGHDGGRHYHKHALEGGCVVVDTLDGALKEAGEIIEAGLSPKQLVELGELVMLKRIKMEEESASDASSVFTSDSDKSPTSDMERLDLRSNSTSLSSVFSDSATEGKNSNSRASSPSRRNSGTFFRRRRDSSHSRGSSKKQKEEDHLCRWLQGGNVIYKSVGLGLMDLAVGMHVIKFAREKGVGHHFDGF